MVFETHTPREAAAFAFGTLGGDAATQADR